MGPSNESSNVSRSPFDLFASETSATFQIQRSQTAAVGKMKSVVRGGFSLERSTDNENAIEGPKDVFEQVCQGNSGIMHTDNQNKNYNKSLQTPI